MSLTLADVLTVDLPALLTGLLAALSCGLVGNFLVLRRQALLGDAMSHVVLPGIVAGFWLSGQIAALPMMLGALAAALLAVGLIELIQKLGRIEPGAAMGVVFTVMFAAGVVMIERSDASGVHLDVEHALYGSLEAVLWLGPTDWSSFGEAAVWAAMPRELQTLGTVTLVLGLLTLVFFKELRLSTFDPLLASSLGYPARWLSLGLMVMVAVAAVAAFDAVGSILVIAMLICPAATARMLTDSLAAQIWLSLLVAAVSAIAGYLLAAFGPSLLGAAFALNAAGMIAVVAGLLQVIAMVFAPRHGVLARRRVEDPSVQADARIGPG